MLGEKAGLGPNFDPFRHEESFLLGSFIFEDVGVTAYAGGADLIPDDSIEAAAGLLATEAYHAGAIRATIAEMGDRMVAAADGTSRARAAAEARTMFAQTARACVPRRGRNSQSAPVRCFPAR